MDDIEQMLTEEFKNVEKDIENTEKNDATAENNNSEGNDNSAGTEQQVTDSTADSAGKEVEQQADTQKQEPVTTQEPAQEPELILGKFKTQDELVKAYQSLQSEFSKRSQQAKQEEKVQTGEFDKMVASEIQRSNWDLVNQAFSTIASADDKKEALYLLEQFRQTGNEDLFEQARKYLDPRVDRRLEVQCMNNMAEIQQKYNSQRDEIELEPVAQALDELDKEEPGWLEQPAVQDLMVEAIKLNRKVDVRAVKSKIKAYEDEVIKRYEAKMARENAVKAEQQAVAVKAAAQPEPAAPKAKPIDENDVSALLKAEYESVGLGGN